MDTWESLSREERDSLCGWVGISAWLLLVIYEPKVERLIHRDHDADTPDWYFYKPESGGGLIEHLEATLFGRLESLQESGHPLALVPDCLRSLPEGVLLRSFNRASICVEVGGRPPLDELAPIWDNFANAESLLISSFKSQRIEYKNPGVVDFLSTLLAASRRESRVDLFARTEGISSGDIPESLERSKSSDLTLFEPEAAFGVIAACRALLFGQNPDNLRVFTQVPYECCRESIQEMADVLIACPPWGSVHINTPKGKRRTRREELYLECAMDMLKHGGRAAVVVPVSILFGDSPRKLRERLVEEFRVHAVFAFPEGTFFHSMGMQALIVFSKEKPLKSIWMMGADATSALARDTGHELDQSIAVALLAKQDLAPQIIDLDDWRSHDPISRDEWISRRLKEYTSEKETDTFANILRSAAMFAGHPQMDVSPPSGTMVPVRDIARRRYELTIPSGSLNAYESFIETLKDQYRVDSVALGEIADIRIGKHVHSKEILKERPDMESPVSVIRPSDLPKSFSKIGTVYGGKVYCSLMVGGAVKPEDLVREGDILLTRIGSVGRLGYVLPLDFGEHLEPSEPAKAIASQQLVCVRVRDEYRDKVRPNLLAKLLNTEPYRNALLYRSAGSVVKHLRIDALRDMAIPLFSLSDHAKLAKVMEKDNAPLALLLEALESKPGGSDALQFLHDNPEWRPFAKLDTNWTLSEGRHHLEVLLASDAVQKFEVQEDGDTHFEIWFTQFQTLAIDLLAILDCPAGSDRLAALQGWDMSASDPKHPLQQTWKEFRQALRNGAESVRNSIEPHCQSLLENLLLLAKKASEELFNSTKVHCEITPTMIPIGKPVVCEVALKNHGLLPLRNIRLTVAEKALSPIGILRPNEVSRLSLTVGPYQIGRHVIPVEWEAIQLDQKPKHGSVEIAIEASEQGETLTKDIGKSPYVFARVLDENTENVFFGRRKAIDQISSAVDRPDSSTIILVEGNRRIGKTSLLKYFVRHHLPAGRVPVFINFQEFDGESGATARPGIPTVKVFQGMLHGLVDAAVKVRADLELPEIGKAPHGNAFQVVAYVKSATGLISSDAPYSSFREIAELIREQIAPKQLLFILDEFDRLQEGIESGITSDQVPENLRNLFQSWNDVAGVFTGSRSIRRLSDDYWNILFGLGEKVRLSGLEQEEAQGLIEEPVKGRLVYSPQAVDEICRLTARQPLLIQGICDQIFRRCKDSKRRSVDLAMVTDTSTAFIADSEHFESIWSYIGSDRKRLIALLIDRNDDLASGVTFELLKDLLEEQGIRITVKDLHADLDDLDDLEVIHKSMKSGIAGYRILVPLLSLWVRQAKDFNEARSAALEEEV